ncbi:hypothetical protein AMATHDRAFT_51337 [Amanita thiersii Skay4041]|uniref:Uncharacterized protein n=1 Tax=Amanita thiersii Skay4041 TaxID=703135 RepID=A0A2A9NE56_9AGAR|nr:hypothetical protein AMATHDRAFT_51337 [Amanita thiersii Skay4041]
MSKNDIPSSIHSLFPEILLQIFEMIIRSAGTNKRPIPFILGQVCSTWRDIILSAPSLWTHIRIPADFDQPPTEATCDSDAAILRDHESLYDLTACLRTMVERAGTLPLIIHYECHREYPSNTPTFQVLLDHIHRWDEFHLKSLDAVALFTLKEQHAPFLRILDIPCTGDVTFSFPFVSCPSLTHLSWPTSETLPGINGAIPWGNLESLKVRGSSATDALRVLEYSTKLRHFEHHLDYDDREVVSGNHIIHTKLQRVSIKGPLLPFLSLPLLSHLHLFAGTRELPNFFLRSGCVVRLLRIGDPEGIPGRLLSTILHSPSCSSITVLCIRMLSYLWFSAELLAALTYTPNSSEVLLPHLKRLHLSRSCNPRGLFGQMIKSRFVHGNSCLDDFEYDDRRMGSGMKPRHHDRSIWKDDVDIMLAIPNAHIQYTSSWITIRRDRAANGSIREGEGHQSPFQFDTWR